MTPECLLRGQGCPICGRRRQINKAKRTHGDFVKQLLIVNPNIDVIGDYESNHRKILVKCKIDGFEWSPEPASLLSGCGFCHECA